MGTHTIDIQFSRTLNVFRRHRLPGKLNLNAAVDASIRFDNIITLTVYGTDIDLCIIPPSDIIGAADPGRLPSNDVVCIRLGYNVNFCIESGLLFIILLFIFGIHFRLGNLFVPFGGPTLSSPLIFPFITSISLYIFFICLTITIYFFRQADIDINTASLFFFLILFHVIIFTLLCTIKFI